MLLQASLQDRLGFPIPQVDVAPEGVGKTTRFRPITEASIPNNAGVNLRGPLQNPDTQTPMKLTHRWPRYGKSVHVNQSLRSRYLNVMQKQSQKSKIKLKDSQMAFYISF